MKKYNVEKERQLGKPLGTAYHQLRKSILFHLVKELKKDKCFRCGKKIEDIKEFSIEHKIYWLHSKTPIQLFFDLDNIDFSHLKCNKEVQRKKYSQCGSYRSYQKGCRCELCTEANRLKMVKYRIKKNGSVG